MAFGIYFTAIVFASILYLSFKMIPFLKRVWICRQAIKQFPMEDYHWFLGHLAVHPGPTHEGFMLCLKWTEKYPRYNGFFIGPLRPTLTLSHPETVKQLTKTSEPKQLSGGGGYSLLTPFIGDGLLVSSGKKWNRNRKLLTPGFHFDILKPYVNVYNICVEKFLGICEARSAKTGNSMEIYNPISLCVLDIVLRCAFSTEKEIQEKGEDEPYAKSTTTIGNAIFDRVLKPHLYSNAIYYRTETGKEFKRCCDYSHEFSKSVIDERKKYLADKDRNENSSRYLDFLDILLLARDENGNRLSDAEIRDEVETFMFAGHDTTASALTWLLYNLCKNPEIQARAQEEVDNLLNDRESESILWSDLSRLPYLTMCIKESMRFYPPIPIIGRELTKPLSIDGKLLPAGTFIDILIWNVHHNPAVWEDHWTYNPERFLPENIAKMDSHAYMPFSAGPRNCIGQNFAMNELKVASARILRRFHLTLDKSKEVKMQPSVSLRPKDGIHIFFKARNM